VANDGVSNLERQIQSQPEELQRVIEHAQVHSAVERLQRARRLWLVGTGTSLHAAELGAAMLQEAGRSAQAVSSMQFVTWTPGVAPNDGIIVISHNAGSETSFAKTARGQSLDGGLRVVSITRQGGGLPEAIETVPKETSETYTVSYTTALIVLAKLASGMGAEAITDEQIGRVPDAVRAALQDPGVEDIPQPERLLVIFGSGPASVTARESALKVREAARFPAEGYDTEYLLHGSAVPLSSRDRVVSIGPPDPAGMLGAVERAAAGAGVPASSVRDPAELHPVLQQIPLTVRLQMLALRFTKERQQDPDHVITGSWADADLWSLGGNAPS
jgi:glucosamine--fructose-6-phosphate aminotransferase (isomerizing)